MFIGGGLEQAGLEHQGARFEVAIERAGGFGDFFGALELVVTLVSFTTGDEAFEGTVAGFDAKADGTRLG